MKSIGAKYKKFLAGLIIVALIIPTVIISAGWSQNNNLKRAGENNSAGSLNEEYSEKLKTAGFQENEINEARILAERVISELKEIAINSDMGNLSAIDPLNEENQEDSEYIRLAEKMDLENAVQIILKLKKDFGSIERAMDEYIYSLQTDISLEKYLKDKKAYEEERAQKAIELNPEKVITTSKIESRMLEKLQYLNEKNRKSYNDNPNDALTSNENVAGSKPPDPLADIEKELGISRQDTFR